jgi:hypothetical protein
VLLNYPMCRVMPQCVAVWSLFQFGECVVVGIPWDFMVVPIFNKDIKLELENNWLVGILVITDHRHHT